MEFIEDEAAVGNDERSTDGVSEIPNRPREGRSRSWVFTYNNYDDAVLQHLERCGNDIGKDRVVVVDYLCYGKEDAPTTGTKHLQGYVYFKTVKSLRTAKDYIVGGCSGSPFLEIARGNPQQNRDYCSKGGEFKEFGTLPQQGRRSDLNRVIAAVQEGKSIKEISKENPVEFIKFHKGIVALKEHTYSSRDYKTTVHWYYGETGTGKSKVAYEEAVASGSYYYKDPTNKWWDGYFQQTVVVIDDYRRDFSTFAHLLRLFDRYPLSVEYKGGTIQFASMTIIITTPKSPKDTWEGRSCEDIAQLLRRITMIRHFPATFAPKRSLAESSTTTRSFGSIGSYHSAFQPINDNASFQPINDNI